MQFHKELIEKTGGVRCDANCISKSYSSEQRAHYYRCHLCKMWGLLPYGTPQTVLVCYWCEKTNEYLKLYYSE